MNGESYYDRGSMDIDHIESEPESSIGGIMRKMVNKVDSDVEMDELKKKVSEIKEGDFIPVSDEYGNELCVYADDFPQLVKESRGSEVMFIIRCGMDKVTDGAMTVSGKSRPKINLFIWDCSLVHGMCGKKKDYK